MNKPDNNWLFTRWCRCKSAWKKKKKNHHTPSFLRSDWTCHCKYCIYCSSICLTKLGHFLRKKKMHDWHSWHFFAKRKHNPAFLWLFTRNLMCRPLSLPFLIANPSCERSTVVRGKKKIWSEWKVTSLHGFLWMQMTSSTLGTYAVIACESSKWCEWF